MAKSKNRNRAVQDCDSSKNKALLATPKGLWEGWKQRLLEAVCFLITALPIWISDWCDALLKLLEVYRALTGSGS